MKFKNTFSNFKLQELFFSSRTFQKLQERVATLTVLEDCMDDICEKEDETKGAKRKNLINYL